MHLQISLLKLVNIKRLPYFLVDPHGRGFGLLVDKGAYTYYVITLGGVGGQGALDYSDYALRHRNDYGLHDYFCTTNFQSCQEEPLL